MSPNSPSTSLETLVRTIGSIQQERGEYYPQKHRDEVKNKNDRHDFLIAAYALITARRKDALGLIIYAGGFARRMQMIKNIKLSTGKQIGLEGMFKKILAFDKRSESYIPRDQDFLDLLEEMRELFEPQNVPTSRVPVVPAAVPASVVTVEPPIQQPRTFMGLPVTDVYVLAILDGLKVEEPKVVEQAPIITPPQPKTQLTPGVSAVSNGVQSKVAKAQSQHFQRPILPPAPRRGFKNQHWGRTAPFIPYHLRTAPTWSEIQTEESPIPVSSEPPKPKYDIPLFDDLQGALVHLHGKTDWHDFYRHIEGQLRDDLAVMSYLVQQNGELRAVLLKIKEKFGTSLKQVIGYLFRPDTIPVSPPPSDTSPSVSEAEPEEKEEKPEDALDRYIRLFDKFKMNDRYMSVVRTICDLHMRGEHEQFLRERDAFFQKGKKRKVAHVELFDINAALDEIVLSAQSASEDQGNIDKTKVMFELSEYRPAKGELFVYDATQEALYAEHTWTTRIAELLHESSQKEAFQKLLIETSESRLVEGLKAITINIPRHNKHDWVGYEEKEALETKLYFVFEDMISHQHSGQTKWDGHVTIDELQKLMRKINFSGIE